MAAKRHKTTQESFELSVYSCRYSLLLFLLFQVFAFIPLFADTFVAKGTNRTLTVSLSSQPPCSSAFTNSAVIVTTGNYVSFPQLSNNVVVNLASPQDVQVQGENFSAHNGASVALKNRPQTMVLASTNLTVFSVEGITRPPIWWAR